MNDAPKRPEATPSVLTPVSRTPIREQVLSQMREAIARMTLLPGQRLVEQGVAEMAGVSRPTVREVLQQLAAEGLVTNIPGTGWFVASPTRKEAEDLYAVRAMLEGMAGRFFTERASDDQVQRLRQSVADMHGILTEGRDAVTMIEAKERFYDLLFEGADNDVIRSIMATLRVRATLMRATSLSQPGRPKQAIAEIEAIIGAIEAREADAAAAACTHHVQQAARMALAKSERWASDEQNT